MVAVVFVLVMACCENGVPCFAITPGTLKWKFQTDGLVDTCPAIGPDGTVYIGSQDNKLYAINQNGTLKWSYKTGDYVSSPAIGPDGTVYVGTEEEDHKLYAINPDGTEKWHFDAGLGLNDCPSIALDGTIYAGSYLANLHAINPDGTEKWRFDTFAPVSAAVAIGLDGTLYVGYIQFSDGGVQAINPDGSEKWHFQKPNERVHEPPAIGPDGSVYVVSWDNNLYAVNPDGTEKWYFETGGNTYSPAIGPDGTVYVASQDGNLYAINPDGNEKWHFKLTYPCGGRGMSTPSIGSDGSIYIGSTNANLYAINPDGTEKWHLHLGHSVHSPAIGRDGTVYVTAEDTLYAIEGDSGGLADSAWPMLYHDLRHTGRVSQVNHPIPDIKVNSSDGPIIVSPSDPVSIKISLDPGDKAGQNADWWFGVDTPAGWYCYDIYQGAWVPGFSFLVYQGPLFYFPPLELPAFSSILASTSTFYFGIDTTMNGQLDGNIYYDTLVVQKGD